MIQLLDDPSISLRIECAKNFRNPLGNFVTILIPVAGQLLVNLWRLGDSQSSASTSTSTSTMQLWTRVNFWQTTMEQYRVAAN